MSPLLAHSRHGLVRCTCPLLTQSGHRSQNEPLSVCSFDTVPWFFEPRSCHEKSQAKECSFSSSSISPRGIALLRDPLLNKGTAFTERERDTLGLRGLLPAHLLSMKAQTERMLTNLRQLPNDLDKYVALNALHDRNEALFFRLVCDNIDEI